MKGALIVIVLILVLLVIGLIKVYGVTYAHAHASLQPTLTPVCNWCENNKTIFHISFDFIPNYKSSSILITESMSA